MTPIRDQTAHARRFPRERLPALLALLLVTALAWLYLWREASMMGASEPMATAMPSGPGTSSASAFALTFLMWSVMMVGMMLPSAAPAILLYGAMVRKNAERGVTLAAGWIFAAGYLGAWTAFSAAVTVVQVELGRRGLLTAGMASANVWLSSAILIAAGAYQWLPVKHACLEKCRDPLRFFLVRWRAGRLGAFRMGLEHGTFCIGCCWVLMLLLFVGGVMNLLWVAVIAGFVFVEKLLPAARLTSAIAGLGLVAAGIGVAVAG